jgi:thiamine transport system ATP-binding protein
VLTLEDVSVRYGNALALDNVSLKVADGEHLAVLGPSGSGKSTLLRVIAGLEPPSTGTITWNGRDLAGVAVNARHFGLMFQDYVLFPQRDVAGNVAFGLEMAGEPRAAIARRVDETLELVGLTGYGRRAITELSGGEQQRVALARALAPSPQLLMLDEPLGALDRELRERLLGELADLFRTLKLTTIYVTHDQEEALAVGDRVAVLNGGRVEALGAPRDLWLNPPTEFVARFMGLRNIADATIAGGQATTDWGVFPVPPRMPDGHARLLIRPDGLTFNGRGSLRGTLHAATFRGSRTVCLVAVGKSALEVHLPARADVPAIGQSVAIAVDPDAVCLLPAQSRSSLSQP